MAEPIQVTLHTLESELETLAAFERWLDALDASLGDRYQVGKARIQCGCPLSVFFSEELGMPVAVGLDGIGAEHDTTPHTGLTYAFMRLIDGDRLPGEPVTIADAKAALKAAKQSIAARISRGDN